MSNYDLKGQVVFSGRFGPLETVDASLIEKYNLKSDSALFTKEDIVEQNLCGGIKSVKQRFRWRGNQRGIFVYIVEYNDKTIGLQITLGCGLNETCTSNIELSES